MGVYFRSTEKNNCLVLLEELAELTKACGAQVSKIFSQHLEAPNSSYLIGKGKVEEIKEYLIENPADSIVFDDDLSPSQQRNVEKILGIKVLDRTKVILDIFAARAKTKEAQLQVELAQLEYLMPRLTGMWQHLERLGGGIGTRGPGETQLETDRRIIRRKIHFLKEKLKKVVSHRQEIRKNRKKTVSISLVGYTNAGKSTLLKALSNKEVYIKDQLFATLDPLVREVWIPAIQQTISIADTVGFIRKLPHHLVDAFKATLEEVIEADYLIHVVDSHDPQINSQIEAVFKVLEDLKVVTKPILTAFNQIDRLSDLSLIEDLKNKYQPAVTLCAIQKDSVADFKENLGQFILNQKQAQS